MISLSLFHTSLFACAQFAESAKLEHAIKANLGGWVMVCDISTNGAAHTSPGQRPGYVSSFHQARKARNNCCLAAEGGAVYGQ